jgi:hypothetical protein
MTTPRLLVLMGSGETSPSMVTTHRDVAARLDDGPRAVLLDTPYGFEENADDISRRALDYFARRVQLSVEVVRFPGPLAAAPAERSVQPSPAALARLRAAQYVFAGPGSPSYALVAWRGSPVPEALVAKLVGGGAVVFASAAALTLGSHSLPVYEIYKVGQPVHWLAGLDVLGPLGLPGDCAVIPHFDNAEGGTHDTRYCYMGERRLRELESLMPATGWILGIDEHTALIVDVAASEAVVTGRGGVTVRRQGRARQFPGGTRLPLSALAEAARTELTGEEGDQIGLSDPGDEADRARASGPPARTTGPRGSPLLAEVSRLERAFETAVGERRADSAVAAILELDRAILDWSADTLQTDDPERARAILHALVHRLGETAAVGLRDPRQTLGPLVDGLIALRVELRAKRAWELADRLRTCIAEAGIELRDTPEGTVWTLRSPQGAR